MDSKKLNNPIIPESVQRFRTQYQLEHLPSWYSGKLHYAVTASLSAIFVAIPLSYSNRFEPLAVALAFILSSFVEYLAHRYPLHHNSFLSRFAYREHTLRHHFYFTEDAIDIEGHKDLHRVLFPWFGIVLLFTAIASPLAYLFSLLINVDFSLWFLAGTIFYFFLYETIHLVSHLPDDSIFLKLRYLRRMKRHHQIHHRLELMKSSNFGVVSPLWDKVFRTLVLK